MSKVINNNFPWWWSSTLLIKVVKVGSDRSDRLFLHLWGQRVHCPLLLLLHFQSDCCLYIYDGINEALSRYHHLPIIITSIPVPCGQHDTAAGPLQAGETLSAQELCLTNSKLDSRGGVSRNNLKRKQGDWADLKCALKWVLIVF